MIIPIRKPSSIFYPVNATTFNGSTNKIFRTLTGITGLTNFVSFSVWINLLGGNASTMDIINIKQTADDDFVIRRNSANKIFIGVSNILNFKTSASYTASSNWVHILGSLDINFSAGNRLSNLYINDVSDNVVAVDAGTDILAAINPGNAVNTPAIGIGSTSAGANFFNGSISQLWLDFNSYVDFSVLANRRKFISATKRPVFLGSDGSRPTGTCRLYFKDSGNSFNTNYGSSGVFSQTGTLTVPTTTPST